MANETNNPAPHAGEKEVPATPRDGDTPGMGRPPKSADQSREPGTRPDGEAMPPAAIDPAPTGSPEDELGEDERKVRDATGF